MKIYTVDTLPSLYYGPTPRLKWVAKDCLDTHPVLVQQHVSPMQGEDDIWVEIPVEDLGKKSKEE